MRSLSASLQFGQLAHIVPQPNPTQQISLLDGCLLSFTCIRRHDVFINIYWAKVTPSDKDHGRLLSHASNLSRTRITPIWELVQLQSTWHQLTTANPNNGILNSRFCKSPCHCRCRKPYAAHQRFNFSGSRCFFVYNRLPREARGDARNARDQGLDGTQKPQSRRSPPDWYGIVICRKFSNDFWIIPLHASCDPVRYVTHTSFRLASKVFFGMPRRVSFLPSSHDDEDDDVCSSTTLPNDFK